MPKKSKVPQELQALLERKYSIALGCGCIVRMDMPETLTELVALREKVRQEHRCPKPS